jgi:hypothetical protein
MTNVTHVSFECALHSELVTVSSKMLGTKSPEVPRSEARGLDGNQPAKRGRGEIVSQQPVTWPQARDKPLVS